MTERSDQIWDRVRALRTVIEAHRAEGEVLKRLPDAIGAAFLEVDLYRILVPEDLGGAGLDPVTYFDFCEEIAALDGSAGWNFALASTTAPLIGMLPLERLREVFGTPDCAIAGTVLPSGKATAAEDGWRIGGRWSWMSGVHQAKWVIAGAVIQEDGKPKLGAGGAPVARQFLFRKDPDAILDAWNVGGMRGTGSTDYACEDAHVDRDMVVRVFSGESSHPSPIFRLPFCFFGLGLCAVALGIARGALEGFVALASTKVSAANRTLLREQPHAQYAAAKAEALLASSRLHVRESFRPIWEAVSAGAPVTPLMRAKARGSYVHAAESALEAVQLCYRSAGGTALFQSAPFEQALRDVNAVTCHATMQRVLMEDAGRVELGLDPIAPFF